MDSLIKSHHPARHIKSFKYAFKGLFHALMNEANFRVEVVIASFFVSMGLLFGITMLEWAILFLALGFLLSAEIMNTLIEEFMDHLIKEHHEGVRVIKDLSAAYVLTASITSLLVFVFIIWNYIFK